MSSIQHSITDYSLHAVYWNPRTYSFYNCNFVPFDQHLSTSSHTTHPYPQPWKPSFYSFLLLIYFFNLSFRFHIWWEIIQHLSFLYPAYFIYHNVLWIRNLVTNGRIFFFLWLNNIPLFIHHIFIHSSIDRLLRCFCILAIVNNTAINMRVQIFLWYWSHFFWINVQNWNCQVTR